MDFLAHPIAQDLIHALMLLHHVFAAEFGADDNRVEMAAIAVHFDVVAFQAGGDVVLNLLRGNHGAPQ